MKNLFEILKVAVVGLKGVLLIVIRSVLQAGYILLRAISSVLDYLMLLIDLGTLMLGGKQ